MIQPVAINRIEGLVFMDDGSYLKMQNLVDRFGDDTEDAEDAISAVVELPSGRWMVIDFDQFETVMRS